MARIYQALQRQSDGRWNMTVSSDDEGWTHAVGFCAGPLVGFCAGPFDAQWPPFDAAKMSWTTAAAYEAEREKARAHASHYHDDGHASAAEAEACHDRYCRLLRRHDFNETDVLRKCAICGAWTVHRVMVGEVRLLNLCGAHLGEADVAAAVAKERAR